MHPTNAIPLPLESQGKPAQQGASLFSKDPDGWLWTFSVIFQYDMDIGRFSHAMHRFRHEHHSIVEVALVRKGKDIETRWKTSELSSKPLFLIQCNLQPSKNPNPTIQLSTQIPPTYSINHHPTNQLEKPSIARNPHHSPLTPLPSYPIHIKSPPSKSALFPVLHSPQKTLLPLQTL